MRRRPEPVWWHKGVLRREFERRARAVHPDLLSSYTGSNYRLALSVEVPGYEPRAVDIIFIGNTKTPSVFIDGPTESPHRWPNGAICMWHPADPIEQRWVRRDGLRALIAHVVEHLFREAWWRDTGGHGGGEWLGVEAPHAPPAAAPKEATPCS